MRTIILLICVSTLAGCGGRRLGGETVLPGDPKGTWVVNPVNPESVQWTIMRGTAQATTPLQTGDWIEVTCTHCNASQTRLTAWTLKNGAVHRTLHLDQTTNPAVGIDLSLHADDQELRVMWTAVPLGAVPTDFENLNAFSSPRLSNVTEGTTFLGELQWGLVGTAFALARPAVPIRLAGAR